MCEPSYKLPQSLLQLNSSLVAIVKQGRSSTIESPGGQGPGGVNYNRGDRVGRQEIQGHLLGGLRAFETFRGMTEAWLVHGEVEHQDRELGAQSGLAGTVRAACEENVRYGSVEANLSGSPAGLDADQLESGIGLEFAVDELGGLGGAHIHHRGALIRKARADLGRGEGSGLVVGSRSEGDEEEEEQRCKIRRDHGKEEEKRRRVAADDDV